MNHLNATAPAASLFIALDDRKSILYVPIAQRSSTGCLLVPHERIAGGNPKTAQIARLAVRTAVHVYNVFAHALLLQLRSTAFPRTLTTKGLSPCK